MKRLSNEVKIYIVSIIFNIILGVVLYFLFGLPEGQHDKTTAIFLYILCGTLLAPIINLFGIIGLILYCLFLFAQMLAGVL